MHHDGSRKNCKYFERLDVQVAEYVDKWGHGVPKKTIGVRWKLVK